MEGGSFLGVLFLLKSRTFSSVKFVWVVWSAALLCLGFQGVLKVRPSHTRVFIRHTRRPRRLFPTDSKHTPCDEITCVHGGGGGVSSRVLASVQLGEADK